MNSSPATGRYSSTSIALHWLMLLLMIGVYALIELREFYPRGSDLREAMKAWHFTLGLSVFALVWLRIVARLVTAAPPGLVEPAWRSFSAKVVHLALYLLMIAMPLAGWVILSAEGKAVPFFGLELPPLVTENKDLAGQVEDLHEAARDDWLLADRPSRAGRAGSPSSAEGRHDEADAARAR
jgi:superoxide oxidase